MKARVRFFIATALLISVALPALAWGPVTQQAIVITAVHVLSKEGTVQLKKLEKDVRYGANASLEVLAELYPGLASGPVRAVESEMYLLQAVRGKAVGPYFAYRLGVLGRLVAQITAPLLDESPLLRDRYYADVDAYVSRVLLKASPRRLVDPLPYFKRVQQLANSRKELIMNDYREGLGFDGIAKAALPADASHSVDAVADVWYTILLGSAAHANVSEAQKRDYTVAALEFYSDRHNEAEIEANYRRLSELTTITPEMSKRIGDMFYEAGFYERAIEEYQSVLAEEPHRKDVVEKIAAYYVMKGDEHLEAKRLELAHDAYANAGQVDPLHPSAEGKRIQAAELIAERDARLETTRGDLAKAADLETRAEECALEHKYAEAFGALKEAEQLYLEVSEEFVLEFQTANAGLATVSGRLREFRDKLVENAQTFSGTGFAFEARQLARTVPPKDFDERALQRLVVQQFEAEINKLKRDLQGALDMPRSRDF